MKKIYLSLSGGLGNQLFTYGFAKYLTKRYNYNVSIDLSFFKTSKLNLDLKDLQTNNIQFEYVFGNNYKLVKYGFYLYYKTCHKEVEGIYYLVSMIKIKDYCSE